MAENKNKSFDDKTKLQAANQQLRAHEQQLKAASQQLNAANQQLRADEKQLKRVNHDMGERVKELDCLYGLSQLVERDDIALEEIFQGLAELIPPGWQYPEITAARVTFEGHRFKTDNFRKTAWIQSADIEVHGQKAGSIEVCYLKKRPVIDEGPFLKEERNLLIALAKRMGKTAERKQAEEALEATNQQLDASNQQLRASEQQLKASNQQLRATEQQLRAANQQLRASEDTLRVSEQRYALAQKAAKIGTWESNIETDIITWVGQTHEIFGLSPGQFSGTREAFYELVHPDDREHVAEKVKSCFEGGGAFEFEHRIVRPDGAVRWVSQTADMFRDQKDEPARLVGIIVDITKRKQTEQSLQETEAELKHTIEVVPGIIAMANAHTGYFTHCNPAMSSILGFSSEEFLARPFIEFIHPDDRQGTINEVERQIKGSPVVRFENRYICKNGSYKWLEWRATAADENGVVYAAATDITERKQVEKEVLNKQKQLRSLATQLSLSEERERRRIAEGLHDDIIQPLAFLDIKLKTFLDSCADSDLADSYQKMRTIIGKLIGDVRDFTFDLSYPVLYALGLEKAVKQWLTSEVKGKHGLQVVFKDDLKSKPLDDDIQTFLFKAAKELLVNVIKHAEATKVKVSLAKEKGNIIICVEDDGIGFSVEKVAKKMTGFGLFNIHDRTDHLGGHFDIKSKHGSGTQAVITMPLKHKTRKNNMKGGDQ